MIDGGSGTDTLDARGADVDITGFAGTISGIEIIDRTKPGADTVTLSAQDVLDMSDSNTVTVIGGPPDTVQAGTGWTDAGFDGGGKPHNNPDSGGPPATVGREHPGDPGPCPKACHGAGPGGTVARRGGPGEFGNGRRSRGSG